MGALELSSTSVRFLQKIGFPLVMLLGVSKVDPFQRRLHLVDYVDQTAHGDGVIFRVSSSDIGLTATLPPGCSLHRDLQWSGANRPGLQCLV